MHLKGAAAEGSHNVKMSLCVPLHNVELKGLVGMVGSFTDGQTLLDGTAMTRHRHRPRDAFLLTALLSKNEPTNRPTERPTDRRSFLLPSLFQVCKFQVGSYSYNMEKMIFEVTHLGYSHTSRYIDVDQDHQSNTRTRNHMLFAFSAINQPLEPLLNVM